MSANGEAQAGAAEIRCAGCPRPFSHGRAFYVPAMDRWYHAQCFRDATDVPIGTAGFRRYPTQESLARFAEHDGKIRVAALARAGAK